MLVFRPKLYCVPAILLLLTACGQGSLGALLLANTSSNGRYHAYGDSITYGATLGNPGTQAYPPLVGLHQAVSSADAGINGAQACDVPNREIFAPGESPSLAVPREYSLLIGTNDVNAYGVGAYEAVFLQCQQASIAWLALPVEDKTLATSSTLKTSGSGHLDTANNWNAWVTDARGSSVSFTITSTTVGPIYAWPRIDDSSSGTYSYALDGVTLGTGSTKTTPLMKTQIGTTNSLGFLRIPAVPAGTHVVTFTQTSNGSGGVSIVGIGSPPALKVSGLPVVLVGTIPFQQKGGGGGACTVSDAPCDQYNSDIRSNVTLFVADGLDVRLFDTRQFMFGKASEMNDALHPNAVGQQELSQAVESVF